MPETQHNPHNYTTLENYSPPSPPSYEHFGAFSLSAAVRGGCRNPYGSYVNIPGVT
jgi:hypothetical protein